MTATRIRHQVNAPRPKVDRALLDPRAMPPGLSPADNEAGWRSSFAKLGALVEAAS
jgi:hypothetical protein